MTSLDGWSLNEKIKKLTEDVKADIVDLKIQFSLLYDFLKKMEEGKDPNKATKTSSKKSTQKN